MLVTPIQRAYPAVNPPRYSRAAMAVRGEEHTVVNLITGERTPLPAREAWALHQELNSQVDILV